MAIQFGLSKVSGTTFLSLKKLTGAGKVLEAGRHNKREIQVELGAASRIDVGRLNLNYSLAGPDTAKGISDLAKRLMSDAGITSVRKDCVRGIEFLFSLPAGFSGDQRGFFTACLDWCASRFGSAKNVLSFQVHNDESNPHGHCLLLPLLDGKMKGSDMVGNRKVLASHQESFHQEVGVRFGLRRAPKQLRSNHRAELSRLVLNHMKRTNDSAMASQVWQTIKAAIGSDPVPFAQAYGLAIESQSKNVKAFVQIMTAPTKPESSKWVNPNPIGLYKTTSQKEQTLSCVGFGIPKASIPASIGDEYSRINEATIPVQDYDFDRGEFHQQSTIGNIAGLESQAKRTDEADDSENCNFQSQNSNLAPYPNIKRLTRWASSNLQGIR